MLEEEEMLGNNKKGTGKPMRVTTEDWLVGIHTTGEDLWENAAKPMPISNLSRGRLIHSL